MFVWVGVLSAILNNSVFFMAVGNEKSCHFSLLTMHAVKPHCTTFDMDCTTNDPFYEKTISSIPAESEQLPIFCSFGQHNDRSMGAA